MQLNERQYAQISELASLFLRPERASLRDELSDFFSRLRASERTSRNLESILLCKELVRLGLLPSIIEYIDDSFAPGEPVSAKAAERVAYLQNRFTDTAFLAFSTEFSKLRAAYFNSFSDVCEEVHHGLCEFCILPIENTDDGKLMRFYGLIEKYELKIVQVCDIAHTSESFTRYALLCHKQIALKTVFQKSKNLLFEVALAVTEETSLSDILSAAGECHMNPARVDTLPRTGKSAHIRYDLVFNIVSEQTTKDGYAPLHAITAFLLYLSLSLPEYIPLGIYEKINFNT